MLGGSGFSKVRGVMQEKFGNKDEKTRREYVLPRDSDEKKIIETVMKDLLDGIACFVDSAGKIEITNAHKYEDFYRQREDSIKTVSSKMKNNEYALKF